MAPNIDREAEHIKERARKDLLALLESVRALIDRSLTRHS